MDKNRMKNPKIAAILLIVTGAFLVIGGILRIVIAVMLANESIGIIGGADAPTAEFILGQLGWRGILRIVLPIAFGILCIIVNVIDLIRRGKP